jgi:predicted ArsR family transcriptional regulator
MKRPLAYELLSPVRQQLVLALKKRGHGDMESLAEDLFLSPGAVRQNLSGLAAQGIVKYRIARAGPGRPKHIYELSSDGQRLFPDFYDEVAVALVTAIEEEAPEVAARVLNRVAEVMFDGLAARVESRRPEQRVREVVKVLEERGYLPESAQVDPVTDEVSIGHCPMFALARRHPAICESELRCLQLAVGSATVTRTGHTAAGDSGCKFTFRRN